MKNRTILISFIVIVLGISTFSYATFNKQNNTPIKIGFLGDFSLESNNTGVQGRNGVVIAIDEINSNGGLLGRQLELITSDNKNSLSKCALCIDKLIATNVSVIIGPLISHMAEFVVDSTKDSDILLISPVVKSNELTGIDDHLFKINTSARNEGLLIADAIIKRKDKKVSLVWSKANKPYTKGVINGVKEKLLENNIDIVFEYEINDVFDQKKVVNEIQNNNPDGIVLVAKGDVVAQITQQYLINGNIPHLYASEWTKITQVVEYGGKSINGMIFTDSLGFYSDNISAKDFYRTYKERFFIEPTTPAYLSYEAVMVYFQSVLKSKTLDIKSVKETLLSSEYKVLSNSFRFNEFGDVIRNDKVFYIVRDNEFYIF